MTQIHPSAIVDSQAELAEDVVVGPFCLVGPKVCIGAGTVLRSHVVVEGSTTIGARNVIYAGASIGCHPQDKKYRGEDTRLVVGDDNVIRENCTMSIGTIQDQGLTTVGSRNLFMANAHVAHDCQVGSDVILANNVALGGHVMSLSATTPFSADSPQRISSCASVLMPWLAALRACSRMCRPL